MKTILNTKSAEENILEDIIINNEEMNVMVGELRSQTKKEVEKKPKTKEELAELKRKRKLYNLALKGMGFIN